MHEANRNNLDLFVEQMSEALEQVMAGEVTTAVRSVEIDGVRAEAGQLIGLLEGKIVVSGDDLGQLMHDLIGRLDSNAYELVTLYYGSNVTAAEAQDIGDALGHDYPYFSFEVVAGGQPHYHFFLSIELAVWRTGDQASASEGRGMVGPNGRERLCMLGGKG